MRLRWLSFLIACLCLGGCSRQLSPEEARATLHQIQTARRSLPLAGKLSTSIRLRDQQLRAEAEMHRGPGAIHMKYLTGRFAGWQVIEQDGLVWRLDPQGKPAASPMSPEAGLGLPPQADLQVWSTGNVRVAGRPAQQYVVEPPGHSRARMVIAVDTQTSYPLSLQRYSSSGKLISETVYSQINYQVAPPPRLKPPEVAQAAGGMRGGGSRRGRKATEQELQQALAGPLLKPTHVPEGFAMRGFYAHETRRGLVAEMRYSDGLRVLSVAQLKRSQPQSGQRVGREQTPGAGQRGREWQRARERSREGRGPSPEAPDPRRGGWWQRLRGGQAQGQEWGHVQRGPLGRSVIRELRGSRVVIVGGDVAADELRQVMQSIPYPPGRQPATKF